MKAILLPAVFIFSICASKASQALPELPEVPTFPVNNGKVDVDNDYVKRDPFYKQRAGSFYETEYLGYSAAKLFKIVDLDPAKRVGCLDILRGYIYDFLDFEARDNGRITAEHCAEAIKTMNEKFRRLLTPFQYKLYEVWREEDSNEVNTLSFLIHYDAKAQAERDAKQR